VLAHLVVPVGRCISVASLGSGLMVDCMDAG
jgi:hypothetical protein